MGHERYGQNDTGANQIHGDEKWFAREPVRQPTHHRGKQHIGYHLERESGAKHGRRISTGEIVGQQGQSYRTQARADQSDHLSREQPPETGMV